MAVERVVVRLIQQMTLKGKKERKRYVRHEARHTNQRIDTPKTDTNPPQPRAAHDAFTELLVTRLKAEYRARPARKTVVDLFARVACEARVVDFEAEGVEILCDEDRRRLLAVEAEGEGLDSAEEEEGVKGRETVSDGVDCKVDSLGVNQRLGQWPRKNPGEKGNSPWQFPPCCK